MITYKKRHVVLGWYIYTRREERKYLVHYTWFLANENDSHATPLRCDQNVEYEEADDFYEEMQVDLFLAGILEDWLTVSENDPDEELDAIFHKAKDFLNDSPTRVHRY